MGEYKIVGLYPHSAIYSVSFSDLREILRFMKVLKVGRRFLIVTDFNAKYKIFRTDHAPIDTDLVAELVLAKLRE